MNIQHDVLPIHVTPELYWFSKSTEPNIGENCLVKSTYLGLVTARYSGGNSFTLFTRCMINFDDVIMWASLSQTENN